MVFSYKDFDIALAVNAIEVALLGIRILMRKVLIVKDSFAIGISALIIPWSVIFITNPDITLVPKIIISIVIAFFLWLLFYLSKLYTTYIVWNTGKASIEHGIENILTKNNLSYQKKENEFILKELNMSIGFHKGRYSEQKIYVRSNKKDRLAFDIIDNGINSFFQNEKADKISYEGILFVFIAIILFVFTFSN
ncbi:MAG: hypothetical protein WCW66_05475 [Patescibacteria group bacterium]|jgi:hypothetical protein